MASTRRRADGVGSGRAGASGPEASVVVSMPGASYPMPTLDPKPCGHHPLAPALLPFPSRGVAMKGDNNDERKVPANAPDQLNPTEALRQSVGQGGQRVGNSGPLANPEVSFPEPPGKEKDADS